MKEVQALRHGILLSIVRIDVFCLKAFFDANREGQKKPITNLLARGRRFFFFS